ncbi:sigma factor-like helix-turn-helix DNA-binding protein [Nonomuraea sp. NPDC050227]|uniref:sigma factor-like helix-turn-helix DNA-binding protein n=1 Tax=Nonomuraea sp. NPDC050227 TaxID=3364360 RepID=UPI0037BD2E72
MSQPLTGQRPRTELIAELYDRHAAGLFAYCADQLGDPGTASDVLASVLSGVPDVAPPRAALYAYARRQIRRRDVVYAPPVVDPLIDPASALVERVLRELRPQQREVLVLCAVCGLSRAELAWVLDVAPDTADELAFGAGHRFREVLDMALTALAGGRAPKPVADVYGALAVAPLRDVLGRLPWPEPPAILRVHFAGSVPAEPGPLFVKPLWPAPPQWPLPLAEADPATSTGIFPADLLAPPPAGRPSVHEATTAPMPKLRDPLGALDSMGPLRDPAARAAAVRPFLPKPPQPPQPAQSPQPLPESVRPFSTGDFTAPPAAPAEGRVAGAAVPPPGERPFFLAAPIPADVLDDEPITQEMPAIRDVPAHQDPGRAARRPLAAEQPVKEAAPLFTPRSRAAAEPVYRMPAPEPARAPGLSDPALSDPALSGPGRSASALSDPAVSDPAVSDPAVSDPAVSDAAPSGRSRAADFAVELARELEADRARYPDPARDLQGPSRRKPGAEPARSPGRGGAKPGARKQPAGKKKAAARKKALKRRRERHYDWAWELIGFLICVAIAMIVFFSVPMFMGP